MLAGEEREWRFVARGPDGAPAEIEPYMGMTGHIAVARIEGGVFAHLHPSGSISMAALQKFAGMLDSHASHPAQESASHVLTTPYAFPRPGRYRLWVQMKRAGQVTTGAFDVNVE